MSIEDFLEECENIGDGLDYGTNAVEVHTSTYLSARKIIDLIDMYPCLKRITCPLSVYSRISPVHIKVLDQIGISVEVKYKASKKD